MTYLILEFFGEPLLHICPSRIFFYFINLVWQSHVHLLNPGVHTSFSHWPRVYYSKISFLAKTMYTSYACKSMSRKCLLLSWVSVTTSVEEGFWFYTCFYFMISKVLSCYFFECIVFFLYRFGRYFMTDACFSQSFF